MSDTPRLHEQEIEKIYLFFFKSWGQYYYPGWCFKVKGQAEPHFIAEKDKETFFVKYKSGKFAYPPKSTDKNVTREEYVITPQYHLYLEDVLSCHKNFKKYFDWSLLVKRAIEYVNDLGHGEYNTLVSAGDMHHKMKELKGVSRQQDVFAEEFARFQLTREDIRRFLECLAVSR